MGRQRHLEAAPCWVPEHSAVTSGKSLKLTKRLDWVPEKWEEIVVMIKRGMEMGEKGKKREGGEGRGERERQTEIQRGRDTQRDRHKDRQTQRDRDTETEKTDTEKQRERDRHT